jgi:hypothetical protein
VETVVKVVICLTGKTSGNRIYSLQHRVKKFIELKLTDQCLHLIFKFFRELVHVHFLSESAYIGLRGVCLLLFSFCIHVHG